MTSSERTSKKWFTSVSIWILLFVFGSFISCNENSLANIGSSEAGESGNEQDSVYVVDVTAADYAFGMPSELPSGWVTFRMKNMGLEEHLGIVSRFPDSISFKQLTGILNEALETGEFDDFLPYLQLREGPQGGPAMVSPGLTGETTVNLEPGLYALTCWVKAPDGQVHLQKGMSRPFTVSDEATGADRPQGTINVRLSNFDIRLEDSVGKGEHIFEVHFEDSHNLHLARLEEGQTLEELKKWMEDLIAPAPFTFIGGAEPAPPGMTGSFKATLEPGRYAFVNYGYAHLGMAKEFEVPEKGKAAVGNNDPEYEVVFDLGSKSTGTIKIPAGCTAVKIKNTLPEAYAFHLHAINEGRSVGDVQNFYREVFIDSTRGFLDEGPVTYMVAERIGPEEVKEITFKVEDRSYLLFGPIPLEGDWAPIINNDDLYLQINGVPENQDKSS